MKYIIRQQSRGPAAAQHRLTLSPAKFVRGMNRRNGARVVAFSLALTALLVAGLTVGLRGSRAQSGGGQPDYSNVDDFMGGGTHLLRNDDLVMTFNYQSASGEDRGALLTAGTRDSQPTPLSDAGIIPQGPGCADSGGCKYDYHQFIGNRPATGRFFNVEYDTTVHYPVLLDGYPYLVSLAGKVAPPPLSSADVTWTSAQSINFVTGGDSFLAAVADFNHDGFDDLLMGYSDTTQYPPSVPDKLRIATAVDVNDPKKGFQFGPEFAVGPYVNERLTPSFSALTVGDFNGDRQPDIAALFVPGDKTLQLQTFTVDPATLTIATGGSIQLYQLAGFGNDIGIRRTLTMTAGNFSPAANQQLAVGFHVGSGQNFVVQIIDFDPSSVQPKLMTTYDLPDGNTDPVLVLKAGKLDWGNPYDQIVWMSSTIDNGTRLEVLTVDPGSLVVTVKANTVFSGDGDPNAVVFGRDIALGNFDHMQPSAADPTKTERDPDLQIAMIALRVNRQNGQIGTMGLGIFDVSEDFSTITTKNYQALDQTFLGGDYNLTEASIVAGDLQGRSYRLGAGTKFTIENYSYPSVITAMPPMHIDYVTPAGATAPTVFNASAVPDSFWAKYDVEKVGNTDTQVTDDQSHSFGFQEQVSGFLQIGGDPAENSGVKIEDTVTATQDIKNINNQTHGKFQGTSNSLTDTTGWGDSVSYTSTTINIWTYPVLGKMVCPQDKADKNGNCDESDKRPLTIQFSAPSGTDVGNAEVGSLKEWYQPVWEPGNIFSYPANFKQLNYAQKIDRLDTPLTFFTDSSKVQESIGWRSGVSADSTVGQEKTFSGSNDLSISGREGSKDTSGFGLSLKFNANGSDAFSNLTLSQNNMNTSTGLTFNKPGTFAEQGLYAYAFQPVIYGSQAPLNLVDKVDLNTDIVTFDALQSAFTVDPTAPNSGGWWSNAYSKPDIALNHPLRWDKTKLGLPGAGQSIPKNCLALGDSGDSTMNCLYLNPSVRGAITDPTQPSSPWGSEFHFMRGFFISNAASPGQGPQLQITDEGTKLTLQTRVYNYSLTPLPANSRVYVRFYAIPWRPKSDGVNPANSPAGNIIQIGEDVQLSPVPNFDSSQDTPNWSLARVDWDTSDLGGQYFTFAVVAWAQVGNSLVSEMPSHGLNQLPGAADSYQTFLDLLKLEEVVNNPLKQDPTDPDQVSFSNNIGFYNSVFYVEPENAPPTSVRSSAGKSDLAGSEVKISANNIKLGQTIQVSAELQTGDRPISSLNVHFYDGDPNAGGKVFDVERVPYIKANDRYEVRVNYRPKACGAHRLFIKAGRGLPYEVTVQSQIVQVACCDPQDTTAPQLAVTLTPDTLWPADGRMVPITAHVTATDDQDPQPEIKLEAITHSDANDAAGDVAGAAFGTDDRQFALRAERDGRFNLRRRVYEVVYSATDCAGNKTFTKAYVTVPRRR